MTDFFTLMSQYSILSLTNQCLQLLFFVDQREAHCADEILELRDKLIRISTLTGIKCSLTQLVSVDCDGQEVKLLPLTLKRPEEFSSLTASVMMHSG